MSLVAFESNCSRTAACPGTEWRSLAELQAQVGADWVRYTGDGAGEPADV